MFDLISHGLMVICIFMNGMFMLAQFKKDNSIVDIGWGLGILLVTIELIRVVEEFSVIDMIYLAMMSIWAIRLASYLYMRNQKVGEDYRYAAWRKEWGKDVVVRAFLQVFLLQGLVMAVVVSPTYVVVYTGDEVFSWNHIAGISLWMIGFIFEAVGDAQMKRFKADPENNGKVLSSGLWKFTRHPNYFGEAVLWWGFGVFSLTAEWWWLSLVGPAVITFFLLKVSGVAMLERKYEGNPRYTEYRRTTNAFLPWFPKD